MELILTLTLWLTPLLPYEPRFPPPHMETVTIWTVAPDGTWFATTTRMTRLRMQQIGHCTDPLTVSPSWR